MNIFSPLLALQGLELCVPIPFLANYTGPHSGQSIGGCAAEGGMEHRMWRLKDCRDDDAMKESSVRKRVCAIQKLEIQA